MVYVQSEQGQGGEPFVLPAASAAWQDLVSAGGPWRNLGMEEEGGGPESHREIGEKLFEALFPGEVRNLYESCLGRVRSQPELVLRIKLMIDPRDPAVAPLQALPWELLRQPDDPNYLTLRRRQSFVRHLAIPRPVETRSWPRFLRVLCVRSSPGDQDLLGLQQEIDALREALTGIGEVIEPETPGLDGVRRALLEHECHVLHFMGHGELMEDASEGVLWLEPGSPLDAGGAIRGEDLANKLADAPSLCLVVLNACDSARTGSASSFAGVASALVLGGLSAVVAMQAPISDAAAIAFSRVFYQRLSAGDSLDAAVTEGRQEIHSLDPRGVEWAIPVLFLRVSEGDPISRQGVIPQFVRSFQPTLPPGLAGRLRLYRRDEIRRVHEFLGSPEKKLLCLLGTPGVGAADLLLIALQEAPPGLCPPVLWWDCEETDSLASLADEWARSFGDQNLALLAQRRVDGKTGPDLRELDREIVAWLLTRLERSPRTIVLSRFNRWLSPAGQEIGDPALANFLRRAVTHPQAGKLILHAEEKPVLPSDLHPGWVETLVVGRLAPADALDFLQNFLSVQGSPEILGRVVAQLEGHPLALQLFAGSLTHLAAEDQEERMRQFLDVGESAFSASSLHPLLESARSRLAQRETQILDLLTAVRQPLTLGEIQEIGAGRSERFTFDEVRRAVHRLVHERYLAVRLLDASRPGQERFRPVQIGRPYLEEKLAEDRSWKTELHRRAFAWYRRKYPASDMSFDQRPAPEVVAAYDELIHQALTVAELTMGDESQAATLVAGEIAVDRTYWYLPNHRDRQGLAHLERAQRLLEALPGRDAQLLAARCLEECGELHLFNERLGEAERALRKALSLSRTLEDQRRQGYSLLSLGDVYLFQDRTAEAEPCYREALSLFSSGESVLGQAHALRHLGQLHVRMHRLPEAGEAFDEALTLYRLVEDDLGEATVQECQGTLYRLLDDLAKAEDCFQRALPLFRRVGSVLGEANTVRDLGGLYLRADRIVEAESCFKAALQLFRDIEYRGGEITALGSLGAVYLRMDRHEEAEQCQKDALRLFRAIGDRLGEADTLLVLGASAVRQGRPTEAEEHYLTALSRYQAIEHRLGEANAASALGMAYFLLDRLDESEAQLDASLRLFRELGFRSGEANTLVSLGGLHRRVERLTEAESEIQEALTLFREVKYPFGEVNTLGSLGDLYMRMGRLQEAEACHEEELTLARAIDHGGGVAHSLMSLGDVYLRTERLPEAEEILEEALAFARSRSFPVIEASTLQSLARLEADRECLPEAEAHLLEALPIFRATEDRLEEGNTLYMLGTLRYALGRQDEAEADLLAARVLFLAIEDRRGLINCSLALSDLYREGGRSFEAVDQILAALLYEMMRTEPEMGEVVPRLVLLRHELGADELDRLAAAALEETQPEVREAVFGVLAAVARGLDEEPTESRPETPPPA